MPISYSTIMFPNKGLDQDLSFHSQKEGTTADCLNVWPYDPQEDRARGGQRDGLAKYVPTQVNGNDQVQDINHIVTSNTDSPALTSAVTRDVTSIAVAGGTVKKFTSSGYTSVTDGASALSSTNPFVYSSPLFQNLYFADGTNYKKYSPVTNAVTAWTASAGDLPINGSDTPRLIETWRQRIVLSGISSDAHNWFMSALGDATDFDYSPATTSETQAVAGNNSEAGKIGDIINTMIPHNDDLLVFGCDHSIWQMTGDPMAGGRIDNVSHVTGMAFGRPWCKTPDGVIYFVGSRGGLFRMSPTVLPFRVSGSRLDNAFASIDMTKTKVQLAYDDYLQGIWIFLTSLDGASSTHYFYDLRTESFWPMSFAVADFNPSAVHVLDGDDPDDRVTLLGGLDGYIRNVDSAAVNDDNYPINSYVYLGPIKSRGQARTMLREIRAVVDTACLLEYDVYAGDSVQQAFESTQPKFSGSWKDGRNHADRRRCQGHAFYIRVGNQYADETWGMETLQVGRSPLGPSAQRKVSQR